ncbi:MAG: AgmX/PglI C-terminal domain-containing protein [Myxococcota bacterium]
MDPEDQKIIVRRFFNDETAAEIGRDLELRPATVRSRIHRSLQRLRASLDKRYGDRRAWGALVLAVPPGATPTPTTANTTMMSITAKLALTVAAGTAGVAGWFATRDTPPTSSPAAPAVAVEEPPEEPPTTAETPQQRWQTRRGRIRASLAAAPAPSSDEPSVERSRESAHAEFRDLVRTCMEDLESDASGALTLSVREIGAPDLGTIYESVEIAHTNFEDAEVLECLQQSMYAYVGDAPDEPFERQTSRTLRLGTAKDLPDELRQITGAIVGAHIGEVRACQKHGPEDVQGSVSVALTIDTDGRISDSTPGESELPDAVLDCIVAATKRWKFPKPPEQSAFIQEFVLPIPGRPIPQ